MSGTGYTAHYEKHWLHSTLWEALATQHTMSGTDYTAHYEWHWLHSTLWVALATQHTMRGTGCTAHYERHWLHNTLWEEYVLCGQVAIERLCPLVVNTGERERPMRRINYSPELLQPAGECMSSVGDWCCMSVYSWQTPTLTTYTYKYRGVCWANGTLSFIDGNSALSIP